MPEENVSKPEETEVAEEIEAQENGTDENPPPARAGFFTRRNAVIAVGSTAVLAILLVLFVTVSYRYGVFDNYVKNQFVAKMADIGIVSTPMFSRARRALQLELQNGLLPTNDGRQIFSSATPIGFNRSRTLRLAIESRYYY